VLPTPRTQEEQYIIQPGDFLSSIAQRYGVSVQALIDANEIVDIDHVEVGQTLIIPAPDAGSQGPGSKLIPDSELVLGPASAYFNLEALVEKWGGYLASYEEAVDGQALRGSQVIQRVALEYSVNPRLLLALLEYQSSWLTASNPEEVTRTYPMLHMNPWQTGLYKQLSWAANLINRGYYLWRYNAVSSWVLADGSVIPIDPTINPGTAALQQFFAVFLERDAWEQAVSQDGFIQTYEKYYGYPFDLAIEPLIPQDLAQPVLQLPFEPYDVWSFTGGPHGGWAEGSAWAALDFAPPGDQLGCWQSDNWVTASADGLVVRTGNGAVVQDLDGDGLEQTGWTILYMHIESRDRVEAGTWLNAGDRIGHASCEGGYSNGTHVHFARRYNREWIPADGPIPFNLDGWISSGNGIEYDGYMTRNGQTLQAWEGRLPENQIQR